MPIVKVRLEGLLQKRVFHFRGSRSTRRSLTAARITHYDAFVHSRTYLILGNDLDLASVSNGGSVPHDSHGLRFGHSVR